MKHDLFLQTKMTAHPDDVIKQEIRKSAADTCAVAQQRGWEPAPMPTVPGNASEPPKKKGGAMLVHPDLPGHAIHVKRDGKWAHMGPGIGGDKMHEAGADADELASHLRSVHTGLAKGLDFAHIDDMLSVVTPNTKKSVLAGYVSQPGGGDETFSPAGADDAVQIGGLTVPHTDAMKPAGPRVIDVDGDQDGATVKDSGDPTDSFRPMHAEGDTGEDGDDILTAEDRWFPNKVNLSGASQKI